MIKLVLVGVVTAACGSDKAAPDAARAIDAAHLVDAAPVIDAAACNTLTLPTPAVQEISMPGAPPTPMGGAVTPGTYIVTALTVYTGVGGASGPNGNTIAAKNFNDGTNYTYSQDETIQGTSHNRLVSAGTFTIDATAKTITTHPSCPTGANTVFGYDATSTSYTLYSQNGLLVNAFVFTIQP